MKTTFKALNSIRFKRAADRDLDLALKKFIKAVEKEPFHNGFWEITEEGLVNLVNLLDSVCEAKKTQNEANKRIETGVQAVTLRGVR